MYLHKKTNKTLDIFLNSEFMTYVSALLLRFVLFSRCDLFDCEVIFGGIALPYAPELTRADDALLSRILVAHSARA